LQQQIEHVVTLSQHELVEFCGNNDEKVRALQAHLDARLVLRGNRLKIIGEPGVVERTTQVINEILQIVRRQGRLSDQQFRQAMRYAADRARKGQSPAEGIGAPVDPDTPAPRSGAVPPRAVEGSLSELFGEMIPVPIKRRTLSPLTSSQRRYVQAIRENTVTFGIGPAGTGKTYLAMAMAAAALATNEVSRIILCRPAVEAGEKLGFLPGDLAQKFDPYVRPLWDALYEMMDSDKIKASLETGVIEIAPLAYMRGRTLNNAFVILDEGQNTSVEQMKMFLTRLGFESKAVITGDVTQVDLPRGQMSGLIHAQRVLANIDGVGMVQFHNADVVRHPLLAKIISAYEQEKAAATAAAAPRETPLRPPEREPEPRPAAVAP